MFYIQCFDDICYLRHKTAQTDNAYMCIYKYHMISLLRNNNINLDKIK